MDRKGRGAVTPAADPMPGPREQAWSEDAITVPLLKPGGAAVLAAGRPWGSWLSVSLLGLGVEFAWAAGEAVLMPHLIQTLELSVMAASLIWLINPVVSVFVQPALGRAMDRYANYGYGRRRPFIVFISCFAALGVVSMLAGEQVALHLQWPKWAILVVILLGFGMADLGHDSLLIPGRVLIGDIGEASGSQEVYEQGHAIFSGFQSAGRFLAEVCGMLPLYGLGVYDRQDTYHTLFSLAVVLILLCCLVACLGTKMHDPWVEDPALALCTDLDYLGPPDANPTRQPARSHSLPATGRRRFSSGDAYQPYTPEASVRPTRKSISEAPRQPRWQDSLPVRRNSIAVSDEAAEDSSLDTLRLLYRHDPMVLVVLGLEVSCWTALHCMAFYWTLWLGLDVELPGTHLRLSFVSLAAQAATMVGTAACMPWLNRLFGQLPVFLVGQALVSVSLLLTKMWTGPTAVLCIGCGCGVAMVIHITNSITISEDMVDNPDLRGTVVALVNATMPCSQIITALLAGPLIDYLEGDVAGLFVCIAAAHGCVLLGGIALFAANHCQPRL
eukprot:EG_transcript_6413